jgi:hypothetical protein
VLPLPVLLRSPSSLFSTYIWATVVIQTFGFHHDWCRLQKSKQAHCVLVHSLDGGYLFDRLMPLYLFVLLLAVLLIGLFAVDMSLLTGVLDIR